MLCSFTTIWTVEKIPVKPCASLGSKPRGGSDVATLDALAWALYANGQYREAQVQIGKVLAVGARDAAFFFHAGAIAARTGDACRCRALPE